MSTCPHTCKIKANFSQLKWRTVIFLIFFYLNLWFRVAPKPLPKKILILYINAELKLCIFLFSFKSMTSNIIQCISAELETCMTAYTFPTVYRQNLKIGENWIICSEILEYLPWITVLAVYYHHEWYSTRFETFKHCIPFVTSRLIKYTCIWKFTNTQKHAFKRACKHAGGSNEFLLHKLNPH